MTERRLDEQSVREMPDEEIKRLFDDLVEAWEDRNRAKEERTDFERTYSPPELPAPVIESVESLIEYNRQMWRYEERKQQVDNQYREHETNFNNLAGAVRFILPEGRTLFHRYGWNRPELQDAEYSIRHKTEYETRRSTPRVRSRDIVVQRR